MDSSLSKPQASLKHETKLTLKLAFPLVIGQLSQMLLGVIDTIMIGKLGVIPLAAATFVNTLIMVPLVLGFGLLSSVSVRVSQAHGAAQPEEAKAACWHGCVLALICGFITLALSFLITPFLGSLGQDPAVVNSSHALLYLVAASMIPAFLTMVLKNHADALNRPWIPFTIVISGIFLNAIFNWWFIFGKWGFPEWGIAGAGFATLLARSLTALALWFWLKYSRELSAWSPSKILQKLDFSQIRSLLTIGVPASVHTLSEVSAFAAVSLLIGTLGATPLAAHQVAITCAGMAFMIPLGISMATTVRIGEVHGAEEHHRFRAILTGAWICTFLCMLLTMLTLTFFGKQISSNFIDDPKVIQIAIPLLIIAGLFQLFDGIQIVSTGALRGIDDVKIPAVYAFISYWILGIPAGALLGLKFGWGPTGMWIGLAIALGFAAFTLAYRAWCVLRPMKPCPDRVNQINEPLSPN